MNHFFTKVSAIIVLSAALAGGVASALLAKEGLTEITLSLQDCLKRAYQNNQRILATQSDIKVAEQKILESRSQFYPKVDFNLNASRYRADRPHVLPLEFGQTLLEESRGVDDNDTFYSVRVWLKQMLYNGGRTRHTLKLAQASLEQARIHHEEIRNQVKFRVIKEFYDVLAHKTQAQETLATLSRVEALGTKNRLSPLQKAKWESVRQNLRRRLGEHRHAEDVAHMQLLNTLGLELYTQAVFEGELKAQFFSLDLAQLLAWAQNSRLEIRQTDYQREIDRLSVDLSRAERYPVVALGTGYELNDREFPIDNTQWNATLNVSVPLFDGFSSRSKIRQRRHQADGSRIERAELEDEINLEVRRAYAECVYWETEARRRVEERNRFIELRRQVEKNSDSLAVAEAEEWVLTASEAYWTAVHGYQVALADLERAVGRSLTD